MIGIVGSLLIKYEYNSKNYSDVVNLVNQKEFVLTGNPLVRFFIDEITYIEDTIYGVEISCGEDDWYISGNEPLEFSLEKFGITGTIELSFLK